MTLSEALEMIYRGETPEEYKRRCKRLQRLNNERWILEDAIQVFEETSPEDARLEKKRKRLEKVLEEIDRLGGRI